MDIMNDLTLFDMSMGALMILCGAGGGAAHHRPVVADHGRHLAGFYLFGNYLIGGNWQPPRVSADTALMTLYASTQGMFGMMADIGTRVVAIYVVFGSLLMAVGAGNVFMRAATLVAGRTFGGPAKVAVVTSALFGTISGSAVANVMSVGTITIPTMIRAGYRKEFAAGIEASASAGGQIMPPVMGAGAFIMAELLNISYVSIAIAAAIPAILYFSAIYFSIDCYARANGLNPMPRDEIPRAHDVFLALDALPAFGPLLLLAWMLFSGYTPTLAGAAATSSWWPSPAAGSFLPAGGPRGDIGRAASWSADLGGLVDGGKGVIYRRPAGHSVAAGHGAVGVRPRRQVFPAAARVRGEQLVGVLLIAALLCIMLGMDVPTTASYLLTASVAAPALIKLGLEPLTAHLYIFYFAILSAITPPVCASVYAAATIVGENFWKVAGQALRIAGAVFFMPFMMVYRPELLLQGTAPAIVYTWRSAGRRSWRSEAARSAICWDRWDGRDASICTSRPPPYSTPPISPTCSASLWCWDFLPGAGSLDQLEDRHALGQRTRRAETILTEFAFTVTDLHRLLCRSHGLAPATASATDIPFSERRGRVRREPSPPKVLRGAATVENGHYAGCLHSASSTIVSAW